MRIGVPKEIKDQEFRVALTPGAVGQLVAKGHQVTIERGAGAGAGFSDQDYQRQGAAIATTPEEIFAQELVLKVKEPLPQEYKWLHDRLILFTYLHLAASRELTVALLESGCSAFAYETVQLDNGQLPLLTPMSMIAGRLATQFGSHLLTKQQGGMGLLLGGIPGVRPGRVVILGGGTVGTEAAKIAVGLGARVQILDISIDRLNELSQLFGARVELLYSNPSTISEVIPAADLVIGAVLVPGQRAPVLVSRELVRQMQPGAVIVDVAVDQGGCIATVRPTSHSQPTYVEEGVLHYGVPNMPGAVPWTATQALVNATLPYVLQLAEGLDYLDRYPILKRGLNIYQKKIVHPVIAQVFPDLASWEGLSDH
ncbi:MAG: alanine dehydrogenase [Pseudanabaenaceae cyanobacterium SKYGB_i_bin29]|nr:alanine dehydrogenase [Pseudanabaenaceae cyanobacterium SKYG29]MDW8421930.1 alanine dehydrogenase [Pseudanabaenaceae cyanobacterium SKYGB_i_bin29]